MSENTGVSGNVTNNDPQPHCSKTVHTNYDGSDDDDDIQYSAILPVIMDVKNF